MPKPPYQTFKPNLPYSMPYAMMDLDDTLFQTLRKIKAWQLNQTNLTVATLDKQGQPLSYFTEKQAQFFRWLVSSTELIPITARDSQEMKRVTLSFNSWQILTHGALIIQPNGTPLPEWQRYINTRLQTYFAYFSDLLTWLDVYNQQKANGDLVITPHIEPSLQPLVIYIAIKHRLKNHDALLELAAALPLQHKNFVDSFYIHTNANNLAILPHDIHKKHALAFLQAHYLDSNRASFGFGDSLADLPFLQQLDWYGTPRQGQLHDWILAH